jgi:hypothetical protein
MRNHRWVRFAIAALPAVLMAAGCATTVADFRLDSVQPDEAAIVGKVDVLYNGKRFTENCSIGLAGASYKLDASGLVFFKVKRGAHDLGTLICQDVSPYHYEFAGARLVAEGRGAITYFGNATVTWKTDGGFKVAAMFGAIGAAIDAGSNDGQAAMDVVNDPEPVRQAFVTQVGQSPPWVTRLLIVGK